MFKALIVLHTMIRNGATDNVLSYLSSSDVLRLKNISSGAHWEGALPPGSTVMLKFSYVLQVTQHHRTYSTMLSTSTRGSRPTGT